MTTRPCRLSATLATFALACALLLAGGCAYRAEVRQGSDRLLDYMHDLRPGMHRAEVRALLGEAATPRLLDDRILLYTYQHRPSGFAGALQQRTVELVFDEEDILQEVRVLQDDFRANYRAE